MPKEARAIEDAYAKQKQKLAETCLNKYRKNLDKLEQECLDDDQLDLANEIRAAIKEKRLPGGVFLIPECGNKKADLYLFKISLNG